MKNTTLQFTGPRTRRRAIELYSPVSPFRGRQEKNRKTYQRRDKHRKDWF
jgi:stalled ribosome alternative rescue factor ArfA